MAIILTYNCNSCRVHLCIQQSVIHIIAKSLGPLRGPILPWVDMRNLGPLSKMKKSAKIPGRVLLQNSRKKARRRNTKLITFAPVIALVTLKIVSLQLNGMLMLWKIQQAMQDDAIQVAIIHQGNRAEMFISENFQPAYRDPGWKNRASPPSHTNTSKISQRI